MAKVLTQLERMVSAPKAETAQAEYIPLLGAVGCGTCHGTIHYDADLRSNRCLMCGREVEGGG